MIKLRRCDFGIYWEIHRIWQPADILPSACNSVLFKGLRSLKGPLLILGHKNGLFLVKKVLFSPFFLLFFFEKTKTIIKAKFSYELAQVQILQEDGSSLQWLASYMKRACMHKDMSTCPIAVVVSTVSRRCTSDN